MGSCQASVLVKMNIQRAGVGGAGKMLSPTGFMGKEITGATYQFQAC